jgi:dTDP-glucose pyrophosphorylase
MTRLVILAAGKGTRMRREAPGVRLEPRQQRMAELGFKSLIPFGTHAFLDYVISAAADAGLTEICLVIGPEPNPLRAHYARLGTRRVRIDFAVQEEPLGNAHALLAAEPFVAGDSFLVVNSDNCYPASAFRALTALNGSGMVGFRREALTSLGGIPAERVAAYAVVTTDHAGILTGIVEKPTSEELSPLGEGSLISMTCWRFRPTIFAACRSIGPSSRGEYELPDAVLHAVRNHGERFEVLPLNDPVLDLASREDVGTVTQLLRDRKVCL